MNTVYLNGTFMPKAEARISVMDRGFLFGDGVYEVIPVYGGKPLRLDEHLQRLENSMAGIKMAGPYSRERWGEVIDELIARNEGDHQSIYLQVSRGAADKRDHAFPAVVEPTVFLMSNPIADIPPAAEIHTATAVVLEDIRWQLCHLKTVALLGNVLLKQEALDRGFDEAVLVREGKATECSASNLFMVKKGVLITPPKSNHLLPGITRDLVVEVARQNGVEVLERDIEQAELAEADELWFTSSTKAIVPIVELGGHPVGQGVSGAVWLQTLELYRDYIQRLKAGEVA